MNKEQLRKDWELKIVKFKESGKSQSAWCREQNINLRTFNKWYVNSRKKPDEVGKMTAWLSLKKDISNLDVQDSKINVRVGMAIIEISSGFDTILFSDVVKALKKLC